MSQPPSRPPILIVGAGLVGLVLAQALKTRAIPFLIYDRASSPSDEGLGWGLTIHWALSIFKSLVPTSILDQLPTAYVDPAAVEAGEKGAFLFYDLQTGEALFQVPPSERLRLRRSTLRQLLLDGIDVKWSKDLADITLNPTGTVSAIFTDRTTSLQGSLLVGCDGSRSFVRQLLLPHSYYNTPLPVRLLGVSVVLPTSTVQPLRNLDPYFLQGGDKSSGVFFWFSFLDGPSSNSVRAETDSYTVQILISWPVQLGDVPTSSPERLALMKSLSRSWAVPFSAIVSAIPEGTSPTTLRLEDWQPPLHHFVCDVWNTMGGSVTLAGDAAHAMTMYRGEAFNHGLRDVEELVGRIEERMAGDGTGAMKEAIKEYEEKMCERCRPAVLASRRACLDAHDWSRLDEKSPLVARRAPGA